jgi:DUF4097 and DUF4098 domain-containing protein YvlB
MSGIEHVFAIGSRPEISVTLASVEVTVVEGDPGMIRVEAEGNERDLEGFDIYQSGDTVTVRTRKGGRFWGRRGTVVRITVPSGSICAARTASGDLRVVASLLDVEITAASGDVHLASFSGRARIRTASGDLTVGEASGGLQVGTASGNVKVDALSGDAVVNTASGDITIGSAIGTVTVKTASGDVAIRRFAGVDLDGASMSGDFDIGLAEGMSIDADIQTRSGRYRNLVSAGAGASAVKATMHLATMSGDITLR